MKEFFELKNGSVVPSAPEASNIITYAQPDETEKKELLETLQLDQHALESALDPDEIFPPGIHARLHLHHLEAAQRRFLQTVPKI